MASKGRPYRTVTVEGYQVLIGRSSRDNDQLSLRVAEPRDLWLHVASGTPGSHVVVRNPTGDPVPASVLKVAAQFAAWYSKSRAAHRVKVNYCLAKDVSKPRGAPEGLVHIKNFKTLAVSPAAAEPPSTDETEDG